MALGAAGSELSCSYGEGQLKACGLRPARSRHKKETNTPGRAGWHPSLSHLSQKPQAVESLSRSDAFLPVRAAGSDTAPQTPQKPRQLLFSVGFVSDTETSASKGTLWGLTSATVPVVLASRTRSPGCRHRKETRFTESFHWGFLNRAHIVSQLLHNFIF